MSVEQNQRLSANEDRNWLYSRDRPLRPPHTTEIRPAFEIREFPASLDHPQNDKFIH